MEENVRAAIVMQSVSRGYLARRAFRELKALKDLERSKAAAVVIQVEDLMRFGNELEDFRSIVGGYFARCAYKELKSRKDLERKTKVVTMIQVYRRFGEGIDLVSNTKRSEIRLRKE
ncbi:unnamed protein product [Anisakis simplex]|uniref:DUF503 domain-containing protein n=1 Tax=Anisakis simplex TaxID=6269 RepID=A0A0M3JGW7_ANISI|nr:unnamed protein product [Anisakis simplex]